MNNKILHARGFTLIEVLIVVVIIAILAAISYPSYSKHVRKSRRTDAQAALMKIALEQERYRTNNTQYASNLTSLGYNSNTPDSHESWYQLSITAANATSYNARATAQNVQTDDSECLNLDVTQNGPDISTNQKATCWSK